MAAPAAKSGPPAPSPPAVSQPQPLVHFGSCQKMVAVTASAFSPNPE
jgi:hypothetical protein